MGGAAAPKLMIPKKFGRVVVKEEFVRLTGDFAKAVILNQFVYWSERIQDIDQFLEEENKRMNAEGQAVNISPQCGWIYKSAEELNEETFLGVSHQTIGRHLQALCDLGYLTWRHNPEHRWDRTKQYRVDFAKLRQDLAGIGAALDGFELKLVIDSLSNLDNVNNEEKMKFTTSSKLDNGLLTVINPLSNLEDRDVNFGQAIPETTTERKDNDVDDAHARMGSTGNEQGHALGRYDSMISADLDIPEEQQEMTKRERNMQDMESGLASLLGKAIFRPDEIALLMEWHEGGVSPATIIAGIKQAVEEYKPRHAHDRGVKTLLYCREIVWNLHHASQARTGQYPVPAPPARTSSPRTQRAPSSPNRQGIGSVTGDYVVAQSGKYNAFWQRMAKLDKP